MEIKIVGVENIDSDSDYAVLTAAIKRAQHMQYNHNVLYVNEKRVPDGAPKHKHVGWFEMCLVCKRAAHEQTPAISIGVIQRHPHAKVEFHS